MGAEARQPVAYRLRDIIIIVGQNSELNHVKKSLKFYKMRLILAKL